MPTDSLHPRRRYNDAATRLIQQLLSAQKLFGANGLHVGCHVTYKPDDGTSCLVGWEPRRKVFRWQEMPVMEGDEWRVVTVDINERDADIINLEPAIEVLRALPELYEHACLERDRVADAMDLAADEVEAWLQSLTPIVVDPNRIEVAP